MVDTVKEAFDIEVQNPVVSPATLASNPYHLNRRLLRPIPIRVRMEVFLQDRLQVPFDHRLGNAVSYRRNS
jgi:hypothetical protein